MYNKVVDAENKVCSSTPSLAIVLDKEQMGKKCTLKVPCVVFMSRSGVNTDVISAGFQICKQLAQNMSVGLGLEVRYTSCKYILFV